MHNVYLEQKSSTRILVELCKPVKKNADTAIVGNWRVGMGEQHALHC